MSADSERSDREAQAGRQLRRFRTARGWSQQQVADMMKRAGYNWRQTTIAKIEAGLRPLRLNEADAISRLFGGAGIYLLIEPLESRPGYTVGDWAKQADVTRASVETVISRLEQEQADAEQAADTARRSIAAAVTDHATAVSQIVQISQQLEGLYAYRDALPEGSASQVQSVDQQEGEGA